MTASAPAGPVTEPARSTWACLDGNEAAARVAHRLSEVCSIYPITPSSPMGELADEWSSRGRTNLWGQVPRVIEMQSEAGAAGALHGAVQAGTLATSFTSSQGLLLMLPTMFKVAGELTPAVLHVAARAIATHALSIFGDHSDVMAARSTGWTMLASSSVQEAHDMAAVAHALTLVSRVPVVHFFDGFRTSHEVNRIRLLDDDDLLALIDPAALLDHRSRAMTPTSPVLRGTSQNPDVFFQNREAANPYHDAVGGHLAGLLELLRQRTGRGYRAVEYHGHPEAERVVVAMGSAVHTLRACADALNTSGERVGVLNVRLYRPFPAEAVLAALPARTEAVAVLDRCKEPGAPGDPLFLDVASTFAEAGGAPRVIGGRYGLGSKEFTPRDAAAVFAELTSLAAGAKARRRFTVGITDDVTALSLTTDPDFRLPPTASQAVFYGLGSDGTVGANKASVKLIGEHTPMFAQGYFVYDSKKAGSTTVSHLRFGPQPIEAPYLVDSADLVAVHQFGLLRRLPVLDLARPGATVLLSSPHSAADTWEKLPPDIQQIIIERELAVWVVDAAAVAKQAGLGRRVNTVMQACFFALAGLLPARESLQLIKDSAAKTYAARGERVVSANLAAIDAAAAALRPLVVGHPGARSIDLRPDGPLDTVRALIAGEGDRLPVSALPAGGTFPTDTARLEKRSLASELPGWDSSLCIDCGKCTLACPHAAIRMKAFAPEHLEGAPASFDSKATMGRDFPAGTRLVVQLAPDDCTGCSLCVAACPAKSKTDPLHKSLTMVPAETIRQDQRAAFSHYLRIPETDRTTLRTNTVKGSQLLQPLFEFSGACSGCGETPYLKLVSQLLGDRMVVANATGCSSIYGGNLPTTPWAVDAAGRGPAWNNSLFEDNAEFGLGLGLGSAHRAERARLLLRAVAGPLGLTDQLVSALLDEVSVIDETAVAAQRERVGEVRVALAERAAALEPGLAAELEKTVDALVPVSTWIVGGDGWAYDIGYGGLDHLFSTGADVNVLVLDTEVYSNTGGQASKATPVGASAKFAASGKSAHRKDLGLLAQSYRDVYVAQLAIGANETQSVRAVLEAASYPGPSLLIAYSPCIAHGIDLAGSIEHQAAAVASGHWPLYRYHPEPTTGAAPRFKLDSKAPSIPLAEFYGTETRYRSVARRDPARAEELLARAQADADERWRHYSWLAER